MDSFSNSVAKLSMVVRGLFYFVGSIFPHKLFTRFFVFNILVKQCCKKLRESNPNTVCTFSKLMTKVKEKTTKNNNDETRKCTTF
eukprot:m.61420 g.61420  ORF g.61420 m.61420 type:complete len:85 (+) comp22978_c1_seq1:301-555(+)